MRSPNLVFFVEGVNLPGISLSVNEHENPFVKIPLPGEKIEFEELSIRFKVDEDLNGYLEIWDWMIKLGFPDNFEQFASIKNRGIFSGESEFSDATVTLLTSKRNSNIQINFHNMFPIALSEMTFGQSDEAEVITATATFAYEKFEIEKI